MKLSLSVLALLLGLAFGPVAGQQLEAPILLPDSFGGMFQMGCVVYDSVHNRVVAGGGTKGLIVFDASSGERVARISTGAPVTALASNPTHGKIYCALTGRGRLLVLDAASYESLAVTPEGQESRALCYVPQVDRVFCTNDGCVFVIDGASDSVVGVVPSGGQPNALLYSPVGNRVYCSVESGRVVAIDAATLQVVAVIPTGPGASALAYQRARNRLYCVNAESRTLSIIDCDWDSVVATLAGGTDDVVYNPLSDRCYVVDGSAVVVVNGETNELVRRVNLPGIGRVLVWTPTANRLYAGSENAEGTISVLECERDSVVATLGLGDAEPTVLCRAGERVFAALGMGMRGWRSGGVAVLAGDSVIARYELGRDPQLGCYSPASGKLYTYNQRIFDITVIDAVTSRARGEIRLGRREEVMAANPWNGKLYCMNQDSLLVVSGTGDSVIARRALGSQVTAIVVDPLTNRVYVGAEQSLRVLDGESDSVLAEWPMPVNALACDPAAYLVYCVTGNELAILDAAADTWRGRVRLGFQASLLTPSPTTGKVYCAPEGDEGVAIVDGPNCRLLNLISVPEDVVALEGNEQGGVLYVVTGGDRILVIDLFGDSLLREISTGLGEGCWSALYAQAGNHLYVLGGIPDNRCGVAVIDAEAETTEVVLPMLGEAGPMVANPDQNLVYVLEGAASRIEVISDVSGVAEAPLRPRISTFESWPNPCRGTLHLGGSSLRSERIAIYDKTGRLRLTRLLPSSVSSIDVSGLADGVYFVRPGVGGQGRQFVLSR